MVLQTTAEDLEYSELLDEAATYPPASTERLLRVAAFAIRWVRRCLAAAGSVVHLGGGRGGQWEVLRPARFLSQTPRPWGRRRPRHRRRCCPCSPYSSTPARTAKPFNPLLGETFEFVCPEKGFRWVLG